MTRSTHLGLGGFVCCIVGTEQYAIAGHLVRLVSRAEAVNAGRDRGSFVGTLRYGRDEAPVYSLTGLFGGRIDRGLSDSHVIVTQGEHGPFGLLVDRIVRTPPAESPSLLSLPATAGSIPCAWFGGLLRLGELSCLVLSPHAIDPRALPAAATPVERRGAGGAPVRRGRVPEMLLMFTSPSLPPISAERYALPAGRVGAIVQSLPAVPLPGAAAPVKALGWWRDFAVPILDASAPGGQRASNGSTRYLLARAGANGGAGFVAFAIDPDATLHRATAADRRQPTGGGAGSGAGAVYSAGGSTIALLDLAALVASRRDATDAIKRMPAMV